MFGSNLSTITERKARDSTTGSKKSKAYTPDKSNNNNSGNHEELYKIVYMSLFFLSIF